jgi:molybdenum cofactor biosynthesis enzyme MoaA
MSGTHATPQHEPGLLERIEERQDRLHISIGAVCNNNCVFCMEEDRDWRYVNNSAMTPERVRWMLEQHKGAEEVCFTSGEPTTRNELPQFVQWSRELGYGRISVMTNGRRLGHLPYAAALAKAGMNRFYVSIHGHEKRLHEGLTRTPDSFEQTVAGLRSVAQLKRFGVELHTSTVLTDRNLPHLTAIYRFLRGLGVDHVVFNVMQVNGRANTFFDHIFPPYPEIAAQFRAFLAEVGEARPNAFLVDIPLCTTEGIPDFHRGYVEKHAHYDLALEGQGGGQLIEGLDEAARAKEVAGKSLVLLNRSDLDEARRLKRDACRTCRYDRHCEGVWGNYVRRRGWDEFAPVPPDAPR